MGRSKLNGIMVALCAEFQNALAIPELHETRWSDTVMMIALWWPRLYKVLVVLAARQALNVTNAKGIVIVILIAKLAWNVFNETLLAKWFQDAMLEEVVMCRQPITAMSYPRLLSHRHWRPKSSQPQCYIGCIYIYIVCYPSPPLYQILKIWPKFENLT